MCLPDSDSEEENQAITNNDADMQAPEPDPLFYLESPLYSPCPSPAPTPDTDLATEVSAFVAALGLQPQPDPQQTERNHTWQTLNSAPFLILHRGAQLTSILFDE
jgi:hypothetical protein